jgi:hypothetical protein
VTHVGLSADASFGLVRNRFRANRLEVSIELDAISDTKWERAVRREWRALAALVKPFYGDARVLRGYLGGKGDRYWLDGQTETHPVTGWWWSGIPGNTGVATCLGSPYLELWPSFANEADVVEILAFLEADDWTTQLSAADRVGGVPADLRMRPAPRDDRYFFGRGPDPPGYPSIWPFPRPE